MPGSLGQGPGGPKGGDGSGEWEHRNKWFSHCSPQAGQSLRVPAASELLEPTVHLPLALLPGPGPALGAEPLQVLLEVLVVHGAVALGLAEALGKEELGSPQCHQGGDPSTHWDTQGQSPPCSRQTQSPGMFMLQPSKQGLCVQGSDPQFPGREHTQAELG